MKEPNRTTSTIPNNGIDTVPIRSKPIAVIHDLNYFYFIMFFFSKSKSINPTPSAPVINNNGKQKRTVPRSYDEWGK